MENTNLYNVYGKKVGLIQKEESGKYTIDLGYIKYCEYTSKYVADFLKESGFLTEEQALQKECDFWINCYVELYDSNFSHAWNAFQHIEEDVELIHNENLEWIQNHLKSGGTLEDVLEVEGAEIYVQELKEKGVLKETEEMER